MRIEIPQKEETCVVFGSSNSVRIVKSEMQWCSKYVLRSEEISNADRILMAVGLNATRLYSVVYVN